METASLGLRELLITTIGGIVVLLAERIWAGVSDYLRERRSARHTRSFLRGWFIKIGTILEEAAKEYDALLDQWRSYRQQLIDSPGEDLMSPGLRYFRITMPDIGDLVIRSVQYIPEAAYSNLLILNSSLRLIDERGQRFANFFDHLFFVPTSYAGRLKMTDHLIDDIGYVRDRIADAQRNYADAELVKWITG